MIDLEPFLRFLPPLLRTASWRAHPLDGKLLLFDRDSGTNILLDGEETRGFTRIAPRTLLLAVTNACNMSCDFCYRDKESPSYWRHETILRFCKEADAWGVLEVAFGGGEPTIVPKWGELVRDIYEQTKLCVNFTTNGLRLTKALLSEMHDNYGQIRLSLYDDNNYPASIDRMVKCGARFGVNWMIVPQMLPTFENQLRNLVRKGVRDFLLLRYKGNDSALHLSFDEMKRFDEILARLYEEFRSDVTLKLDICWGQQIGGVPLLFPIKDCGAGDDFLSITSDKKVKVCSFVETVHSIPFDSISDLRQIWGDLRGKCEPLSIGGCGRQHSPGFASSSRLVQIAPGE